MPTRSQQKESTSSRKTLAVTAAVFLIELVASQNQPQSKLEISKRREIIDQHAERADQHPCHTCVTVVTSDGKDFTLTKTQTAPSIWEQSVAVCRQSADSHRLPQTHTDKHFLYPGSSRRPTGGTGIPGDLKVSGEHSGLRTVMG